MTSVLLIHVHLPHVSACGRRFSRQWRIALPLVLFIFVALPALFYFIQQDQLQRRSALQGAPGNGANLVRAAEIPSQAAAASPLPAPKLPTAVRKEGGAGVAGRAVSAGSPTPVRKCSEKVVVLAVGDCPHDKPIGEFTQRCGEDASTALKQVKAELALHTPEYSDVREFRTAGGHLIDGHQLFEGSAYLPHEIWALKGEELFVFPACQVGLSYPVHLPSVSPHTWVNVTVASTTPRVMVVENFLSKEECKELIDTAHSKMAPSTVSAQGNSAKSFREESRTSSTAWLPPHSHTLASKLYNRVSELVGIPFTAHKHIVVEDLQVLRYEINQHYHIHHDYFDPKLHHGFLQGDGRNRFITVLFYLSDVEEGGETCFPMAGDPRPLWSYSDCGRGLRVAPQAGKAVIFYSLMAKGQRKPGMLDEASWHSGCDVKRGTKWGANYWVTLKHVHE